MAEQQMANYTLTIEADSGYESTTEGRCTAEQYGQAMAALHGTIPAAQRQWVGLTQQERKDIWREAIGWGDPSHDDIGLMIAIEAKLKEKNT
jgi:hypothetical protein